MALQDQNLSVTHTRRDLLDLEKKYFQQIDFIIHTPSFTQDLLNIEQEIQLNYTRLASTWEIKNKLKVAAERLVRHHVYKNLIPQMTGIYESPISSDLGIVFTDCILCIDCKTLDTEANANDINYTSVEPNQTSFDNSNHPYIKAESNLERRARITRLPILTYIIKIIYRDDNVRFDISRTTNSGGKPSVILTCIPNGELSDLFNKDLIINYKTYKYYKKLDGTQYIPISIPSRVKNKEAWARKKCLDLGYTPISIPMERGKKTIYWDPANNCYWTYTSDNKKKQIRAIKRGDSMRLNNEYLAKRFDSSGIPWTGYIEFDI